MKVVLTRNLGSDMCRQLGLVAGDGKWDPEKFLVGTMLDLEGKPLESLLAQKLVEEAKVNKVVGQSKEPALTGK